MDRNAKNETRKSQNHKETLKCKQKITRNKISQKYQNKKE